VGSRKQLFLLLSRLQFLNWDGSSACACRSHFDLGRAVEEQPGLRQGAAYLINAIASVNKLYDVS
jgi:hypothetical protein